MLLILTSFARSFKEAQAYLIPLMLASLGPGLAGVMPGLTLHGALAVTPLVNIVLLARDIFEGGAEPIAVSAGDIVHAAVRRGGHHAGGQDLRGGGGALQRAEQLVGSLATAEAFPTDGERERGADMFGADGAVELCAARIPASGFGHHIRSCGPGLSST